MRDIDAGSFYNVALTEGDCSPTAQEPCATDTDDETVTLPQNPDIEIIKSSNPTTYSVVGQVITYTFTATNTGNVTLYGVAIEDPLPGLSPLTCVPPQPTTLAPGAQLACTATLVITQAHLDAGKVNNEACVASNTGLVPETEIIEELPQGPQVSDCDEHVVPATEGDVEGLQAVVADPRATVGVAGCGAGAERAEHDRDRVVGVLVGLASETDQEAVVDLPDVDALHARRTVIGPAGERDARVGR